MKKKMEQAVKRSPGRPPRTDNPMRLAVLVPGELRRWLRIRAAEEERDMGDIVTESLAAYRKRVKPMGRR